MNEEKLTELRESWYKQAKEITEDTFQSFITMLSNHPHDYNTICYACAAGAIAGTTVINKSKNGGITGFQAGAITWEFIQVFGAFGDPPFGLKRFENLLFPQYDESWLQISVEIWKEIQSKAKKLLENRSQYTHPNVLQRWKDVMDGKLPCGFSLKG